MPQSYIPFTKEMKKDYTILIPNMLPTHFKLIMSVLETYGYKTELLQQSGAHIAETGLKYTHNDTCYPAILVIGQFLDALLSGKYDTHKVALIMFQTGGGCRASNYIYLIRKALKKANLEYIPVISLSLAGIEKHPGFTPGPKILKNMIYATLFGDLMMSLTNQVKPYEKNKGECDALVEKWTNTLGGCLGRSGKSSYAKIKENYAKIIDDFAKIKVEHRNTVKVGIVGEIFVKYSPLANNSLEKFLLSEGAEPVVPGLFDFLMYCVYNALSECRFFKKNLILYPVYSYVYRLLCKKKRDVISLIKENGVFEAWTPFEEIVSLAPDLISTAVKMGEGWLLTAEMLELSKTGCTNIVCTQPFGCLPNHICGKGMMKPIKEKIPNSNIVAIDYDTGASRVNQENRLKLMLFNARRNKSEGKSAAKSRAPQKDTVQKNIAHA